MSGSAYGVLPKTGEGLPLSLRLLENIRWGLDVLSAEPSRIRRRFMGVWGGTPVTSVMGLEKLQRRGIAPAAPSGREKLSLLLSGRCILILLPLPGKALWKQRSQFWSNLLEKLLVR